MAGDRLAAALSGADIALLMAVIGGLNAELNRGFRQRLPSCGLSEEQLLDVGRPHWLRRVTLCLDKPLLVVLPGGGVARAMAHAPRQLPPSSSFSVSCRTATASVLSNSSDAAESAPPGFAARVPGLALWADGGAVFLGARGFDLDVLGSPLGGPLAADVPRMLAASEIAPRASETVSVPLVGTELLLRIAVGPTVVSGPLAAAAARKGIVNGIRVEISVEDIAGAVGLEHTAAVGRFVRAVLAGPSMPVLPNYPPLSWDRPITSLLSVSFSAATACLEVPSGAASASAPGLKGRHGIGLWLRGLDLEYVFASAMVSFYLLW